MALSAPEPAADERADLLQSLARQRHFLRHTTRGLTDEQAARQTTVSELCLGGLIKHVALTEQQWMRFIINGPAAMSWDQASAGDWMAGFKMLDGETLASLLQTYAQVAHRTEELVAQLPDLDAAQPLPPAPSSPARYSRTPPPLGYMREQVIETGPRTPPADPAQADTPPAWSSLITGFELTRKPTYRLP